MVRRVLKYELDELSDAPVAPVMVKIVADDIIVGFATDEGTRNFERNNDITIPITVPNSPEIAGNYVRPRGLMIRWIGTPPDGYESEGKIFIPIFRSRTFSQYKIGHGGEFRESRYIIVSKLPEVVGG